MTGREWQAPGRSGPAFARFRFRFVGDQGSWRASAFGGPLVISIAWIYDARPKSRGRPSPWSPPPPPRPAGAGNGGIANGVRNFRDSWAGHLISYRRRSTYGCFAYLAPRAFVVGRRYPTPAERLPEPPRNPTERDGAAERRKYD